MPTFTVDLTPIFQAIIATLAAIITYKLIPWIKSRTTAQQQKNLAVAASIAVYAAEQIFNSDEAQAKFNYAVDLLRESGYDLSMAELRGAIESAVNLMKRDIPIRGLKEPEDEEE